MSTVILEVREGVGGEEASLFAYELLQMYQAYANKRGWKVKSREYIASKTKGIKSASVEIIGDGVSDLKNETGTHRVQRVPATEQRGRVHTSTATVAVLDPKEILSEALPMNEIRITTCRSSGAGGQYINKTESAVRAEHIPTGVSVYMQDERSQRQNKERAIQLLNERVKAYRQGKIDSAYQQERRDQIGNGDRSEKIRTYNFPQDRITDHRINKNFSGISKILAGNMDKLIKAVNED